MKYKRKGEKIGKVLDCDFKWSWEDDMEHDLRNLENDIKSAFSHIGSLQDQVESMQSERNEPTIDILKKRFYNWLTSWMK